MPPSLLNILLVSLELLAKLFASGGIAFPSCAIDMNTLRDAIAACHTAEAHTQAHRDTTDTHTHTHTHTDTTHTHHAQSRRHAAR